MQRRKGFTLIELLIVISVLALLVTVLLMTINPTAQIGKANDAERKKDLQRIKVAFEEYYNDKGCYPTNDDVVASLMNRNNCNSSIFSPWLNTWPCDPHGDPYMIAVERDSCPGWYKVMAKLENENDPDIPTALEGLPDFYQFGSNDRIYTADSVNYGVSSTNVDWYSQVLATYCTGNCYQLSGSCQATIGNQCSGSNCYSHYNCLPECRVVSCDGNQ